MTTIICAIPDCERKLYCREWCRMHYNRWRRHGDPTIAKYRLAPRGISDIERLWFFADKTPGFGPDGDCWLFSGSKCKGGYGYFSLNCKTVKAHRYAFFVTNGYWPTPDALHSCDVRNCINPDHIRQGTPQDNTDDMISRGRRVSSIGSANGMAILSETDIPQIRQLLATGVKPKEIGPKFGVKTATIGAIYRNKLWKHIPDTIQKGAAV